MTDILTRTDLIAMRSKAWGTLESRYPDDATLALIRSIDRQLEVMAGTAVYANPDSGALLNPHKTRDDLIVSTSIEVFKTVLPEPAFGNEVVKVLRKRGVPLPENDKAAASKVGQLYAHRREIFKQFKGKGQNATSKWHLQHAA